MLDSSEAAGYVGSSTTDGGRAKKISSDDGSNPHALQKNRG